MSDDQRYQVTSEVGPWAFVPVWVLDVGLTGNELAVYVALRSFADRAGAAYPHVRTIADRAGCSERTVARALQRFRELNLMESRRLYKDDGSIQGCWYRLYDVPRPPTAGTGTEGGEGTGTGDGEATGPDRGGGTVAPPSRQPWHHPPDTAGTTPLTPLAEQNTPRNTPRNSGGGAGRAATAPPPAQPPPTTCPDHPNGTTQPCRACGAASRAREAWDREQAQARERARSERLRREDAEARRTAAPPPVDLLRSSVRNARTA